MKTETLGNRIRCVCVVGAGTIGSSWASFYASRGLEVRLTDSDPSALKNGLARARKNLLFLMNKELIDSVAFDHAVGRLQAAATLEEGVKNAHLVHESALEQVAVKKELFGLFESFAAPWTILASSSSGLLMSEIQEDLRRPERALIAHPFNPPHLVPLVELVGGKKTSEATIAYMKAFYELHGKVPVVLKKEVPGHIANRLAAALWREAIALVADGVASVEDVDKALHAGPGIRWAFMGQHLIYHLGGGAGGYEYFINHIGKAFEEYFKGMADWTEIPEEAKRAVVDGVKAEVGERTSEELCAWRDDVLVRLLKTLRATAPDS